MWSFFYFVFIFLTQCFKAIGYFQPVESTSSYPAYLALPSFVYCVIQDISIIHVYNICGWPIMLKDSSVRFYLFISYCEAFCPIPTQTTVLIHRFFDIRIRPPSPSSATSFIRALIWHNCIKAVTNRAGAVITDIPHVFHWVGHIR